jgi:hypothetical protein
MPGLVIAWLVGEGILVYRSYHNHHRPPMPGQLLLASGVFAGLGLMAQSEKLSSLAATLAVGFDIAAFMNIAPELLTGFTSASAKNTKQTNTKTKTPAKKGAPA